MYYWGFYLGEKMKITKSYLKQVIAEELEKNLEEASFLGGLKDKFAGTKLGQKMGMQTDKQKQDATKAAQDKKYRDYQETQAKTMATKNIVKNMVEEFPKKATYIHIHNPGGNSRQYAVDITYDVGSKRDQTTRKVFNEMEPRQLSSLLYNLGIYPDEATKVNDKDLGFNRGQFNVEVDRIKGTFDSKYKEWYQKFFGGQYKDFPEALQQGAQQLGLRNLQENNMKITKNYLKQVIMEELQKEAEGSGGGIPRKLNVAGDRIILDAIDQNQSDAINKIQAKINADHQGFWVGLDQAGSNVVIYAMPVGVEVQDISSKLWSGGPPEKRGGVQGIYSELFVKNNAGFVTQVPRNSFDTDRVNLGRGP